MFEQGDFLLTPDQIAGRRKRLDGNKASYGSAKYVGEGIGQMLHGAIYGLKNAKLDKQEQRGLDLYSELAQRVGTGGVTQADLLSPWLSADQRTALSRAAGIPAYQDGTRWHPGGLAMVGEAGPEIVKLPRGAQVVPNGLPACENEDSTNCYWDALTNGNGTGQSFYDINGETFYTDQAAPTGGRDAGGEPVRQPRSLPNEGETIFTFENDAQLSAFNDMSPDEKRAFLDRYLAGYSIDEALAPEGWSSQGMTAPGMAPQVPAMTGGGGSNAVGGQQANDYLAGDDLGRIELQAAANTQALKTKQALMSFMDGVTDYEAAFQQSGGGTMFPGAARDRLNQQRVALQMQMKDLYELGALQGPDMELLNKIIGVDPTGVWPNILDATGISELDDRFYGSTSNLRDVMLDLAAPKLREYGIDAAQIAQKTRPIDQMSDEEFLQSLGIN